MGDDEAMLGAGELGVGVRGRGAGLNPTNRFESLSLNVLGEHADEVMSENPDGTQVKTLVYRDRSKTILNRVDSSDIHFNWTVNPYRGCEHGCFYCYARPGHEYLGLSCGLDFETKITAKYDAAELLRAAITKPKWTGEPIICSGVTDPYQPIEAKLRITRGIVEVCAELGQPLSLITKNRLITRDIDLFKRMREVDGIHCAVSLTTLDPKLSAKMEPRASSPAARLLAIRELAAAGIPVKVMTAPIIPGINDHEIPALLKAASEAGATGVGYVFIRLPHQLKALFLEWLQRHFPDRAGKVESLIRQARDGELSSSAFGERMRGSGAIAQHVADVFHMFAKRYGLTDGGNPIRSRGKVRTEEVARGARVRVEMGDGQGRLFG